MPILLKGEIENRIIVHELPHTVLDILAWQEIGAYEATPLQIVKNVGKITVIFEIAFVDNLLACHPTLLLRKNSKLTMNQRKISAVPIILVSA